MKLTVSTATLSEKDPRDITNNGFNRFDPKYVSIGPKAVRTTSSGGGQQQQGQSASVNKCATLRHGGRYGGSLTAGIGSSSGRRETSPSPLLKNVQQPMVTPQFKQQQQQLQQPLQQQHMQLQDAKPERQQKLNISTVSKEYQQQSYSCATLPYKKPSGFSEPSANNTPTTTSILKKESNLDSNKQHHQPQPTVYSIDTSHHHQQPPPPPQPQPQTHHRSLSSTNQLYHETGAGSAFASPPPSSAASTATTRSNVSIINQPLPEIPTAAQQQHKNNQQPLCAATLNQYRSLQRPSKHSSLSLKEQNSHHQQQQYQHQAAQPPPPVQQKPSIPPKVSEKYVFFGFFYEKLTSNVMQRKFSRGIQQVYRYRRQPGNNVYHLWLPLTLVIMVMFNITTCSFLLGL